MDGVREFIRRLVFTLGTGNADMHLKNWSLIYRDGINPTLSPAYDLVPTMAFHPSNELGLSLGGAKLITAITLENFAKLASKAELSSRQIVEIAKESSEAFLSVWTEHKHNLPFPAKVREQLESHIAQCELFSLDKGVSGFGPSLHKAVPIFLYAGLAGIAGDTISTSPEAILYNLANKAYVEQDYSTSLKLFDSSIQTKPTALAYYNRGCAHALLNQLDDAVQDFAAAYALGGLAEAAYNSAIMEIRLNDEITTKRPQIVGFLNSALTRKPDMGKAWYNLGVYYLIHRMMDGAVESFLRAIEYEQSLAEAYFNLAITFFISGNRKNADRYFARAAAQNSKYADLQPKQTLSDHVYLTAVSAPGGPVGPNGNPMS
jgi:tetratricopeptide (TPR) repeat protein